MKKSVLIILILFISLFMTYFSLWMYLIKIKNYIIKNINFLLHILDKLYKFNKILGIFFIFILNLLNSVFCLPFYLLINVYVVFILKNTLLSIFVITFSVIISSSICLLISNIWRKKIVKKINKYEFVNNMKLTFQEEPWKASLIIRSSIIPGGIKNYILSILLNSYFIFIISDLITNIIPLIQIFIFTSSIKNLDNLSNEKAKFNYINFLFLLITLSLNFVLVFYIKKWTNNRNSILKNTKKYLILE